MSGRSAASTELPGAGFRKYVANPGDIPEGTLVEMFFRAVDEYDKPDAFLLNTESGWQPMSHRQVLEHVRHLSRAVGMLGLGRGDRVALLSENRWEWPVTDYALLCSGALTVPVYATLPASQIAHILRHSGAKFVFVSNAEQLEKVHSVRSELPELQRIFVFDEDAGQEPEVTTFSALLGQGKAAPGTETEFRIRAQEARPQDLATLIYTSGTTGVPKGVMLTHNNLNTNVIASLPAMPVGAADISLSFLPLSHVFQRMVDYAMFSVGVTIAHLANIDNVSAAFRDVKPTLAVSVPRVYEKLYARILSATGFQRKIVLWARSVALAWTDEVLNGRTPSAALRLQHALADRLVFRKVRERLGGRIKFFISGGAPLSPQLASFFWGAGIRIYEGYGLTETSPVTNVNTAEAMRVGTVGKAIQGTEIAIAEDGEILVRGPQVMKGYYANDQATREAIDEDGWFHTGDIGDIDADGYLRITDRKKDLLVTAGGKNIAPQPIQNAAKTSRFVAEAVMLGDRRPYPILLVVPNYEMLERWAAAEGLRWESREQLVTDKRVRAKLEEDVLRRLEGFARYELPKKILPLAREFSIDRGEITPSLKVRRAVVESNFREAIEELYSEPAPDQ